MKRKKLKLIKPPLFPQTTKNVTFISNPICLSIVVLSDSFHFFYSWFAKQNNILINTELRFSPFLSLSPQNQIKQNNRKIVIILKWKKAYHIMSFHCKEYLINDISKVQE